MNPVNGGKPPSDIKRSIIRAVVGGDRVEDVVKSLIVFDDVRISIMKVVVVIKRYSVRLSMAMFGFNAMIVVIHPRWAIDENAIIFRVCVWLRPPHPPMSADISPIVIKIIGFRELCVRYIKDSGANFCHVVIISAVFSEVPCSTSGNQKCRGARPSFMDRAIVSMVQAGWFVSWEMSHVPVCHAFVVLANSSKAEAAAWVRKYLVVASVERGWWCFEIIGIMDKVFSSRPTQAISQCVLDMVMIVPIARLVNISDKIVGLISIGRV